MYFACYEGKYGIIDKFVNVILDFKYDDGFRCGTENEFSIIERNKKYAFYNNLKREFLTGFDFNCDNDFEDSYYPLSSCGKHSAFPVRKNERWAFMDFYGNMLASKWLVENELDKFVTDVTNVKEPAYLHIDDRCICFNGNFEKTLNEINNFSVYWKK